MPAELPDSLIRGLLEPQAEPLSITQMAGFPMFCKATSGTSARLSRYIHANEPGGLLE
ncbi:hypothetical protein FF011L_00810 [Roseimaritima multifibrata]|uniref:Uncharacterized protein n=1 Tax=Roseimaritima multifibrata TaxID=1930274 RepID=A0A517M8Y7_9BACT|nr:hypothetical protein FF011L_00810 [Roseimaritima multifibrata]